MKERRGTVVLEKRDQIAYISFDRPEKGNALTYADYEAFRDYVLDLDKDDNIRVVIITGTGDRFFSAGDDLNEYPGAGDNNPWSGEKVVPKLITQVHASVVGWRKFWDWDKITIAALNGTCSVAEMVWFSDFVIAAENARIAQPEVWMGVMPGGGGTQILPRLVGTRRALEICLLSEYLSAEDACRIGLVNKVVPLAELMNAAEELAQKILKLPPLSIKLCKKAVVKALDLPLDDGMVLERAYCNSLSQTEDFAARMKAFVQKKPAPPPVGR